MAKTWSRPGYFAALSQTEEAEKNEWAIQSRSWLAGEEIAEALAAYPKAKAELEHAYGAIPESKRGAKQKWWVGDCPARRQTEKRRLR